MTTSVRHVLQSGVLSVAVMVALTGCNRKDRAVRDEIREAVSSAKRPQALEPTRWKVVQALYKDRKFKPIWTSSWKPKDDIRRLITTLCSSEQDGLRPGDYHLAGLKRAVQQAFPPVEEQSPAALAALDLQLTARFVNYGADLPGRTTRPGSGGQRLVHQGPALERRQPDPRRGARQRLHWDDRDPSPEASGLRRARGRARQLPEDPTERRLASDPRRKARSWQPWPGGRRSAATTGAERRSSAPENAPPVYDDAVAAAVARFQRRHGIPVDSTVTGATLAALDTPVDYWIRQIEINLERYRWLPPDFGSRYILVNIPDYHLNAFDGGKPALDMRVIVGDEYGNATPVFADSMSYLVFHPQWYLPRRIVIDEIIPQAEDNDSYLADHNFEVVSAKGPPKVLDPKSIDWKKVDTTRAGLSPAAEIGPRQSAWPGEVHVPQPILRVLARHSVGVALQSGASLARVTGV